MAMIGAMMPKMRFADAVMALPVPRSLVGKTILVFVRLLNKAGYVMRRLRQERGEFKGDSNLPVCKRRARRT